MFPDYKQGFIFRRPDGWEDLGKRQGDPSGFDMIYTGCKKCNKEVHLGRENDEVFIFCPICMKKWGGDINEL